MPTWNQIVTGTGGGTTPPPTSFSIEGMSSNGRNYLGWLSVAGESNYQVQRRLKGTTTFANTGSPTANTFFNDTSSIIDGETYEYQVLALITGATSNTIALSPEFDLYATTDVATPTNFHGFCVAGNRINLTWRKGNEQDYVSYAIEYRVGTSGSFNALATFTPVISNRGIFDSSDNASLKKTESIRYYQHDLTTLAPSLGTTIQYRVKAFIGTILESAWSSTISVTVAGSRIDCTGDQLKAQYDAAIANSSISFRVTSPPSAPIAPITVRPGLSVECVTDVTLTFDQDDGTNNQWYLALFRVNNLNITDMNVEFKNVSIDCLDYQGRAGWAMYKVRYVVFTGCFVTESMWQGIGVGEGAEDCVITNCILTNAGYGPPDTNLGDTWANEGGSFIGNINIRGDSANVQILYNTVNSLDRGYGVKQMIDFIRTEPTTGANYNLHTDTLGIGNVFNMGNRFWQNASPQFSWEIWACDSMRVYLGNNFFTNQVSLEHRNQSYNRSHRYSVKVWHNDFDIKFKSAMEISNHDLDIRYNFIDMRTVQDCEEVFGDYNQPLGAYYNTDKTTIAYNLVLVGSNTPNFVTRKNQASKTYIYGNTYRSTLVPNPNNNQPGLYSFYNIRTYDSGSPLNIHTDLYIENNIIDIIDGGTDRRLITLSTDAESGGFATYPRPANPGDPELPNTGRATINGVCSIQGNLFNATVITLPTTATLANNIFVATTDPQYVGTGTDRRTYRPQVSGNMYQTGSKVGRTYNTIAPNRGCYQ